MWRFIKMYLHFLQYLSFCFFFVTIGIKCLINDFSIKSYMGLSFATCSELCHCDDKCGYMVYIRRFHKCDIFGNASLANLGDQTPGRIFVTSTAMTFTSFRKDLNCSIEINNINYTNMCSFDNFTNAVTGNMRVTGSRIIAQGPLPSYSCADENVYLECSNTRNWIMDRCIKPCFPGKPWDYAGNVSVTETGVTCQRWDTDYPHVKAIFVVDTRFPDGSMEEAGNKCREPDFRENRTWCYTIDPAVRWEYCDVLIC